MTSQKSDDSVQAQQKGRAWGALLLAGGFEVGYALSVNGSQGFTNLAWSLIALVFFLCTLFFVKEGRCWNRLRSLGRYRFRGSRPAGTGIL